MSSSNKVNAEKPVTTKDIANLYTHLQTMIDNVPQSPQLERARSLQDRSSKTPSTPSLNTNTRTTSSPRTDCPCHHILVSKDSEYCALCDDKIPMLAEIQRDRELKSKKIDELQRTLNHEQDLIEKYQQDVKTLNKRVEQDTTTISQTQEDYNTLKMDMVILEKKLAQEKKEADAAKKAKVDLEDELEELSQKLFEEANSMVANEKRAKHTLEVQYNHVQEELKLCRLRIETDELQLKELKSKLGLIMEEQSNDSHTSVDEEFAVENRATQDLTGLFKSPVNGDQQTGDELVQKEFKEFVYTSETIPIRKLHTSTSYMKNSLIEDIEPCLRFGPQSRLSAKKLCDAILMNTCFIEEAPYGFAQDQAKRPYDVPLKISASKNMIWDRFSGVPLSSAGFCQACGRITKELPYRFRISMIDDWACIDRYCRDRLVSVCEFYVFLRNIRQGYYNGRTIPDLFRESLRLKLQMFYARMGELSQTLVQLGIKGDIIGHASEPNMIIPPPSTTIHPRNSVWIPE